MMRSEREVLHELDQKPVTWLRERCAELGIETSTETIYEPRYYAILITTHASARTRAEAEEHDRLHDQIDACRERIDQIELARRDRAEAIIEDVLRS